MNSVHITHQYAKEVIFIWPCINDKTCKCLFFYYSYWFLLFNIKMMPIHRKILQKKTIVEYIRRVLLLKRFNSENVNFYLTMNKLHLTELISNKYSNHSFSPGPLVFFSHSYITFFSSNLSWTLIRFFIVSIHPVLYVVVMRKSFPTINVKFDHWWWLFLSALSLFRLPSRFSLQFKGYWFCV